MSDIQIWLWADGTEERKRTVVDLPFCWRIFFFSLLSTGVGMNRSRSSWNKKDPQSTVARTTRSSQARHTDPAETLESEPGLYGKQRKKQTDSALAQDLSQMSVSGRDGLPTRWGHVAAASFYFIFIFLNV